MKFVNKRIDSLIELENEILRLQLDVKRKEEALSKKLSGKTFADRIAATAADKFESIIRNYNRKF